MKFFQKKLLLGVADSKNSCIFAASNSNKNEQQQNKSIYKINNNKQLTNN